MRIAALVLAGLVPMLAACAGAPAWVQPVIAENGAFSGPVVATAGGSPIPAAYEDTCETGAGRWQNGGWRSYGPGECSAHGGVVRARY